MNKNYKRTRYLINPKFQLRISLYLLTVTFITSIIYPLSLIETVEIIVTNLQRITDIAHLKTMIQDIEANKSSLFLNAFLIQCAILAIFFIYSIFQTHHIAGPLYKLEMEMQKVAEGGVLKEIYFRKHDHFKELAQSYNEMVKRLQLNQVDNQQELLDVVDIFTKLKKDLDGDEVEKIDRVLRKLSSNG